ncbi:DNA recombination protein RmuC [Nocardioides perillae]|uniref:DNA recombination protein RmuC n=1 Tax=Nocardioides perillae TaxID=1119534 RepID=A0A7Y9UNQ7_9ACTN|nr:DNA recombination protein RmuC [Nocardioides perillae]NYG56726.1 DNA recombination protein RmuC [Nocardioides perillae]
MDLGTVLPLALGLLLALLVGLALGAVGGVLWSRARAADAPAVDPAALAGVADAAVVRDGLDRLQHQLGELARDRASWQGRLAQQVEDVRHGTELLRRETRALSTALRKPQVRGRWGEMHLRRAVELAGLVDRCDFEEQVRLADGALRPDLVVRLAGGRSVVVDAKVPLDAFLDATEVDDEPGEADPAAAAEEREHHLRRHAAQLRSHVEALAARRYWRALPSSPEFVVLFVPGESFLAAALEADPRLLDDAAAQRVVLATPTTLIALLRTVALGWTQESLADRADEIQRLGRDLHDRLAVLSGHLDSLGRSLTAAVGHYNATVGSYEARVLVAARRFGEAGLSDEPLGPVRQVEQATRSVAPAASRPHSA